MKRVTLLLPLWAPLLLVALLLAIAGAWILAGRTGIRVLSSLTYGGEEPWN